MQPVAGKRVEVRDPVEQAAVAEEARLQQEASREEEARPQGVISRVPPSVLLAVAGGLEASGNLAERTSTLLRLFAGGAYLTACAIDKLLQAPESLARLGILETSFKSLNRETRQLVIKAIQEAQKERDAAARAGGKKNAPPHIDPNVIQKTILTIKALIPAYNSIVELLESGSDVAGWLTEQAAAIDRKEIEISRINLGLPRRQLPHVTKRLKSVAQTMFRLIALQARIARYPVGYVKDKSYRLWQSSRMPAEALLNMSDVLRSHAERISACFKEVHFPNEDEKERLFNLQEESQKITQEQMDDFKARFENSPEARDDLLYLIENHPQYSLTKREKKQFREALQNAGEIHEDVVRKLLVLEKTLTEETDHWLVPSMFHAYSPEQQYKIYAVVKKHAALEREEGAFLKSLNITNPEELAVKLSKRSGEQQKLERLLIDKFNGLSQKDKNRVAELSPDQFRDLHPKAKQTILAGLSKILEKQATENGQAEEDLKALKKIQKKLKGKELTDPETITAVLLILRTHLDGDTYVDLVEKANVDAWLTQQIDHEEPSIDIETLRRKMAPAQGPLAETAKSAAALAERGLTGAASILALGIQGVAYTIKPHGIEVPPNTVPQALVTVENINGRQVHILRYSKGIENIGAWIDAIALRGINVAELAFQLGFVQKAFANFLVSQGMDLPAAEEFLRQAPAASYTLGLSLLAKAQGASQASPLSELFISQLKEIIDNNGQIDWTKEGLSEIARTLCEGQDNEELRRLLPAQMGEITPESCPEALLKLITSTDFAKKTAQELGLNEQDAARVAETLEALKTSSGESNATHEETNAIYSMIVSLAGGVKQAAKASYSMASSVVTPILTYAGAAATKVKEGVSSTLAGASEKDKPPIGVNAAHDLQEAANTLQYLQSGACAAGVTQESLNQLASAWTGALIGAGLEVKELREEAEQALAVVPATVIATGVGTFGAGAVTVALAARKKQQENAEETPDSIVKGAIKGTMKNFQQAMEWQIPKPSHAAMDVVDVAVTGSGFAGMITGIANSSLVAVPILIKHIGFPLLRVAGRNRQAAQSALYGMAARARLAAKDSGAELRGVVEGVGKRAQDAYDYFYGRKKQPLSKERIIAFTRLTPPERRYLVDMARKNSEISEQERRDLAAYREDNNDADYQKEIAKKALPLYDSLKEEELLSISPGFFPHLDKTKQSRVVALAMQHGPLTPNEMSSVTGIVAKFNSLPPEIKAQIHSLSPAEFRALPPDEREDILFRICNSKAYASSRDMKKPTPSWRAEEFHRVKRLKDKELAKVLAIYNRLEPVEIAVMTPSYMRQLASENKVERLKQFVTLSRRYNLTGVESLQRSYGTGSALTGLVRALHEGDKAKSNKLLESLAFACNSVRPHQIGYFLHLTKDEYESLGREGQIDTIRFLLSHASKEDKKTLLVELSAIEKQSGEKQNAEAIVTMFNNLAPELQAEFRENRVTNETQIKEANVHKDVQAIEIKLRFIESELTRQSTRMLATQLRLDNLESERAQLDQESAEYKKVSKKIEEDTKTINELTKLNFNLEAQKELLRSDLASLALLLPEEEKNALLQKYGASEFFPAEWLAYFNYGSVIASKATTKAIFDGAYHALEFDVNVNNREMTRKLDSLFTESLKNLRSAQQKILEKANECDRNANREGVTDEERMRWRYKAFYNRHMKANLYGKFIEEFERQKTAYKEKMARRR